VEIAGGVKQDDKRKIKIELQITQKTAKKQSRQKKTTQHKIKTYNNGKKKELQNHSKTQSRIKLFRRPGVAGIGCEGYWGGGVRRKPRAAVGVWVGCEEDGGRAADKKKKKKKKNKKKKTAEI